MTRRENIEWIDPDVLAKMGQRNLIKTPGSVSFFSCCSNRLEFGYNVKKILSVVGPFPLTFKFVYIDKRGESTNNGIIFDSFQGSPR